MFSANRGSSSTISTRTVHPCRSQIPDLIHLNLNLSLTRLEVRPEHPAEIASAAADPLWDRLSHIRPPPSSHRPGAQTAVFTGCLPLCVAWRSFGEAVAPMGVRDREGSAEAD